ncbi:MAG: hypothetical protein ACYDHP_00495 [Ferrimicrobium sp.]
MTESNYPDSARLERIESCNSLWVFDTQAHRYLRLPRATVTDISLVSDSAWEAYENVTIDPIGGEFIVRLNASGSRLLRSQRHSTPCPNCDNEPVVDVTRELRAIGADTRDSWTHSEPEV